MQELEYIRRVLSLVNPYDGDEIFWTVTDGVIQFQVDCSDLFYWACADCEPVTPENLSELERSYAEMRSLIPDRHWESRAQELFACRVRGMRPQRPVLNKIEPKLLPLFLACGPERDD